MPGTGCRTPVCREVGMGGVSIWSTVAARRGGEDSLVDLELEAYKEMEKIYVQFIIYNT